MTDLKSFIGRRSQKTRFHVSEERLREFCEAVGAPYRGEAPPTFMTVFRDGEFAMFHELGFSLSQVLHADQEYRYSGKILPGDQLEAETVLSKAFEKQGATGSMKFLVYETDVKALRGADTVLVGVSKTTVIVR